MKPGALLERLQENILIFDGGFGTELYRRNFFVNTSYDNLFHAEGIYVMAVKDADSTNLVNESGNKSAFYDFYIRTCWYGTDAKEPSTISTVIRLYDPDAI